MSPAPLYSLITISRYDWQSDETPPKEGEYLRSLTRRGTTGGTVYLIREIRAVCPRKRLPRSVRARYWIRAVKIGPYRDWYQPDGVRVLTLAWDSRGKRRG